MTNTALFGRMSTSALNGIVAVYTQVSCVEGRRPFLSLQLPASTGPRELMSRALVGFVNARVRVTQLVVAFRLSMHVKDVGQLVDVEE